jgi:signal transduction histidine kinase
VKTVNDFVMTGSSEGSVNIWNTSTKLHRVAEHNLSSIHEHLIDENLIASLFSDTNDEVRLILASSGSKKLAPTKLQDATSK